MRPDRSATEAMFQPGSDGLEVIPGAASGGLELLEFEGAAVNAGMFAALTELCEGNGLGELIDRIYYGWAEETPSGGVHLYYRREPREGDKTPGNVKLAGRPHPDTPASTRP